MSVDLENALLELAPRLLRYLIARLGDRSLAEEVAQESLTALVRRCRGAGPPNCCFCLPAPLCMPIKKPD